MKGKASVQNAVSDICTRLFLHGFGGEVLAEVSHHVERVVRRSGEDASGGLETQVCAGSMGDKKNQSI